MKALKKFHYCYILKNFQISFCEIIINFPLDCYIQLQNCEELAVDGPEYSQMVLSNQLP